VAPFKPKDADLFAIISAFDTAYTTYNGYQNSMERFWTLQYLRQHSLTELTATVFKTMPGQPAMARADDLPLVLPVIGASHLQRGAKVQLRLSDIDDISLDIHGQLLQVLDDAHAQTEEDTSDEDDDSTAGPIAVAVDVNEAPSEAGASA
jgi:exoribonuclease-2